MTTCLSGLNNYCPKYHTSCRSQPFNLTCSPRDTKWFEQLRHNCSAISPKFDNRELWSITIFRIQHFTAQSYNQNATSNRISWLEQQSCSSHFIWVLTPFCHRQGDQRGRMKLQEPPSSPPPPPPPLPLHINVRALMHILHIFYLPLPCPFPPPPLINRFTFAHQ